MKKTGLLAMLLSCLSACSSYDTESMEQLTDRVFSLAEVQFTQMDSQLTPTTLPRSLNEDGTLRTSDIGWWCSGFFPGSLWYVYEYTHHESVADLALKNTLKLDSLQYRPTDHDIGFQMSSSYGNAYRLTGNEDYMRVMRVGAWKLAERFNPVCGVTRSWDFLRKGWKYPVIIDNMMNLDLLLDVASHFQDDSLAYIACRHADVTMKNHFRPDYTSYHLVNYDPEDGHVISRETVQGYADESAWSRGQAWALYGYTMMYGHTHDWRYLEQAVRIADVILPRLPSDGIPFWDFDAPDGEEFRDSSAASIMASALVALSGYAGNDTYLQMAEKQMRTLASPSYLADAGTNGGFLLRHGVGNKPDNSEVDVPLTYADYYFLEALLRYKNLKNSQKQP